MAFVRSTEVMVTFVTVPEMVAVPDCFDAMAIAAI
jgi:hypothetical protein